MRTDFLHFNGAVERDPAIDAWMKAHAGASCANHGQAFPNRIMEVLPTIVRNCFEPSRTLLPHYRRESGGTRLFAR